jgi:hypothetical protein
MSARLFHRLRRCRVLLAMAVYAWLALAGVAGARDVSCPMMMADAVSMASLHHDGSMPCAPALDCCAHAPVVLPVAVLQTPAAPAFAMPDWRLASPLMPRPARAPPLRPPSAGLRDRSRLPPCVAARLRARPTRMHP